MPLWMKLSFALVAVWTLVLWAAAIGYGYVCPAPWFERPATPLRVRPWPTGPSGVNTAGAFCGGGRDIANAVRADTPPGAPDVGNPMLSSDDFFTHLKRKDPLHWKPR